MGGAPRRAPVSVRQSAAAQSGVAVGEEEVPLVEAPEGAEDQAVAAAVESVLADPRWGEDFGSLSRDQLVDAVVARMGEQRARQGYKFRKLLLPIQKAVERHFALRRAETVVVTNAEGHVLLSNVELRSLVRQLLRREDLREGYTVKQCREAVIARLQAGEGVTRAGDPGVSLNGSGFGGLVLQEWSCLWESAWRDYVYHVEELQVVVVRAFERCGVPEVLCSGNAGMRCRQQAQRTVLCTRADVSTVTGISATASLVSVCLARCRR